MADDRLRDLERRWNESGAIHDEATFLVERVRAGDLKSHRLQLAAHLSHGASMLALGLLSSGDRVESFSREEFSQWIDEFFKFPDCQTAIFRALVAGIRVIIPHLADNLRHEPQIAEALDVIERWVLNPVGPVRAIDLSGLLAAAGNSYMANHISPEVICLERQSYNVLKVISMALDVVRSVSVLEKDCSADFFVLREFSKLELEYGATFCYKSF